MEASKAVRNNPYLADAGVLYGALAVVRACDEVLGLPAPMVTTGSEVKRVVDHLAARFPKES